MMQRIRKSMDNKDQGFTLIELLVVIIIIGILSAIAIPLFLNQRKKAEDSAAKADVSTVGKEIATWLVDAETGESITVSAGARWALTPGTGPAIDVGDVSNNVVLTGSPVIDAGDTDWCVHVTNANGDKATTANGGFSYSAANGLQNATC